MKKINTTGFISEIKKIKRFILSAFLLCLFNLNLYAITDTLRHYNPAVAKAAYSGYVAQSALFVPKAPGTLLSVIVELGGGTGTAVVHIYGHEAGNTPSELQRDIITPIQITKTLSGNQKIKVDLPVPVYIANNFFYVAITDLTAGVTLLSDNENKIPYCSSLSGGDFNYQYLKNSVGTWFLARNAFIIDAIMDYPLIISPVYFKDISLAAGLDTASTNKSISWGDFNNDDYLDLMITSKLYKNNGNGTFTVMPNTAGINVPGGVQGSLFADMDNDGNLDLIHIFTKDTIVIYRNNGNETFTPNLIPGLSGYRGFQGLSSFSVADINGDKYPDLFLGRLWTEYPASGADAPRNMFFINDKSLGLIDSSILFYPPLSNGHRSRGSMWADYDNDGDPDLYVSNYYLERDELWQNNGNGTFTNVIAAKGIDINSQGGSSHGTGVDWYDYDNDGDMDLLVSQFAHPRFVVPYDHRGTTIYRNEGPPGFAFTDLTATDGIEYEETHSGGSWGDANNDGLADIYITAYYGCRYADFYLQKADNSYEMKTFEYGFKNQVIQKDAAWVDYDNDGNLDLASGESSANEIAKFRLYRNEAPWGGNHLELDLVSTSGNHFAIGARVTVYAGGKRYMQEVSAGRGQMIQKPARLHFGLAGNTVIDSVLVRWPNGSLVTEAFIGLNVNNRYKLIEGGQVITHIINADPEDVALMLYPNPARDIIQIKINAAKQGQVHIQIADVLGKVMKHESEKTTAGIQIISYDITHLSPGIYFIRIINEKETKELKFVKH